MVRRRRWSTLLVNLVMQGAIESQQREERSCSRARSTKLDAQITEILGLESAAASACWRAWRSSRSCSAARPEVVHLFDQLVRTAARRRLPHVASSRPSKRLEIKGVAQSSTRVSALMRNIDESEWLEDPDLEVVEIARRVSALGSEFTLFANQVGVQLPGRGGAAMNFLDNSAPRLSTTSAAGRSSFAPAVDRPDLRRWSPRPGLLLRVNQQRAGAADARSRKSRSCARTFEQKQKKAANFERLQGAARRDRALLRRDAAPAAGQDRGPEPAGGHFADRPRAPACEEKLFQPADEVQRDFYAELPIKIRLTGSYHEFGNFVSGIAALPRIVTLHDIEIKPADEGLARRAGPRRDRQDLSLSRRGRGAGRRARTARKAGRRAGRQARDQTGRHAHRARINRITAIRMRELTRNCAAIRALALVGAGARSPAAPASKDDLDAIDRRGQGAARRPHRAAARGQALRIVRLQRGRPALAVHAGRPGGVRGRRRAARYAATASSSSSSRSTR